MAEHSFFARARADGSQRVYKDCKNEHGTDKATSYLFYTCSICVVSFLK